MRITRRLPFVFLALAFAIPMFGAVASDVTLPIAGYAQAANDVSYRTELVLTNYRDQLQYVEIALVQDGHTGPMSIFPLDPLETKFMCCDSRFGQSTQQQGTNVAAWRIRTLGRTPDGGPAGFDPEGRIEATAFIVADRGRFASNGASRQEIAGIPASEYNEEEAIFLGVRHSPNTGVYTNVGIVNMDTTTETFFVQFQRDEPIAVVVPPHSLRQIRIPGDGGGFRFVRVYPEWSVTDESPARTTAWVAYASSVDMKTGDAFSGLRVPPGKRYDAPGPDQ